MKSLLLLWAVAAAAAQEMNATRQTVEVEFSLTQASTGRTVASPREGDDVKVRFKVRDKASGTPLENRYPSSWMEMNASAAAPPGDACKARVQRILNADLFSRPEIDLNNYYVLVLNRDASITVVDPIFGYGNTKLLATIALHKPGDDWAFSADQKLLFVSMPESGEVAAIDTSTWRVVKNISAGTRPGRLTLQPDGHYLWIVTANGVAALDTAKLEIAAQLRTGEGSHELAISPDSRHIFVTNAESVSIVDTGTLTARSVSSEGFKPRSIAYSAKSQLAYATDSEAGTITAINAGGAQLSVLRAQPGVGPLRFARDGRYGFVLNARLKRIHIIDSAVNRIVQTAETEKEPDQVTFSSKLAFIRQRGSEIVLMIPMDVAGLESKAIPVAEFPAGQHPLDKVSLPSSADTIVRVPNEDAVLVANPGDKAIYYYKEGMAAPMGSFSNYGKEPRAVTVIDRTLRQTEPGIYETTARLEKPGLYTAIFLLDSPQAVKCWDFTVEKDPARSREADSRFSVVSLSDIEQGKRGVPLSLRFRIDNGASKPKSGVTDVRALAFLAPGVWQTRLSAKALGDGVYEIRFLPPQPGSYYFHVEAPSIGIAFHQNRLATITVE